MWTDTAGESVGQKDLWATNTTVSMSQLKQSPARQYVVFLHVQIDERIRFTEPVMEQCTYIK
jgi:hypothetical protein